VLEYSTVKQIHTSAAVASYALFFVRGLWMMRAPAVLASRWLKIVPHVIDTVLLASAIALASMLRQYPFGSGWLTAKVTGLVVYVVLGTIALGRTLWIRVAAWIAAQLVFLYIVSVAITKDPLGIFR